MSVQSVSRAFTILKTVADHPHGIGVTELARRMNVHKSTVSRLLSTLEEESAVTRLPHGNGFAIGDGLIALIPKPDTDQAVADLLRPLLEKVTRQTGETCGLSIREGNETRTICFIDSDYALSVRDWTDETFPLHISSSGKQFLAWGSEVELDMYLKRPLIAHTAKTLTNPIALRQRILEIRKTKCDWTVDEFEDGLAAASVPVFDDDGNMVAAIYVVGPKFRFPGANKPAITSQLIDIGQQASRLLSSKGEALLRSSSLN